MIKLNSTSEFVENFALLFGLLLDHFATYLNNNFFNGLTCATLVIIRIKNFRVQVHLDYYYGICLICFCAIKYRGIKDYTECSMSIAQYL